MRGVGNVPYGEGLYGNSKGNDYVTRHGVALVKIRGKCSCDSVEAYDFVHVSNLRRVVEKALHVFLANECMEFGKGISDRVME